MIKIIAAVPVVSVLAVAAATLAPAYAQEATAAPAGTAATPEPAPSDSIAWMYWLIRAAISPPVSSSPPR